MNLPGGIWNGLRTIIYNEEKQKMKAYKEAEAASNANNGSNMKVRGQKRMGTAADAPIDFDQLAELLDE